MNLLFICSRNQWRSPSAEQIYKNRSGIQVKSAGTSSSAKVKLTAKTILWADLIFVMEKKHKQLIIEKFPYETEGKSIITLNILDDYHYMDPELLEEIQTKVEPYLG